MQEDKRRANERKFSSWDILPNGGRRYVYEVLSRRSGWKARYVKEVDAQETTVLFLQEIYNADGHLVEIHRKFPEDTGHQRIEDIQ